jgi:hypothetical protein
MEQNVITFRLFVFQNTSVHAYMLGDKPLIKQQFVVTHRDRVLQETVKPWPTLNRPTIEHVVFLRKHKESKSCGHNILTGVLVTQLSSNAGIWVGGNAWVTKTYLL